MTKEITESAKAVKEIAKTTGQAIGVVERLGQFFARIMAEPIDATCGMIADTLKFKRWERQIKLVEKAERILSEKNIVNQIIPISPKLALPIFHNASLEDDEYLHDIYAKLLASSLDPKANSRRTAFSEILRQLEAIDVRILQNMYEVYLQKRNKFREKNSKFHWYRENNPPTYTSLPRATILEGIEISEEVYWAAIDNLCRLGLADSYFEEDSIEAGSDNDYQDVVISHGGYDSLCITALGIEFVCICNY